MNIPNLLTLIRIILVPFLVVLFYLPLNWSYMACSLVFAFAAVTDWFDGYLARRWNQSTPFGAFFDPVADKIMVVTALCLLIESFGSLWVTIPTVVIIGREIVISALREWMAEIGKRTSVAVSMIGKAKTMAQMVAITFLLITPTAFESWSSWLGIVLLYISSILTLWSMVVYLRAAWPDLTPFKQN